jgi:hypothetical protein
MYIIKAILKRKKYLMHIIIMQVNANCDEEFFLFIFFLLYT